MVGSSSQACSWMLDCGGGCWAALPGALPSCVGRWAFPWELLTGSFSLEKFLKILLGLEQWICSSSAPQELHIGAGLVLQQGLCFEIFFSCLTWEKLHGRGCHPAQGMTRDVWLSKAAKGQQIQGPELLPAPGHSELAMLCTCSQAWVHILLSVYFWVCVLSPFRNTSAPLCYFSCKCSSATALWDFTTEETFLS